MRFCPCISTVGDNFFPNKNVAASILLENNINYILRLENNINYILRSNSLNY